MPKPFPRRAGVPQFRTRLSIPLPSVRKVVRMKPGNQRPPLIGTLLTFRTLIRMPVFASAFQHIDNPFQTQVQDSVPLISKGAVRSGENTFDFLDLPHNKERRPMKGIGIDLPDGLHGVAKRFALASSPLPPPV